MQSHEPKGFAGEGVLAEHLQVWTDPDIRSDVPQEPVAQHPEVGHPSPPNSGDRNLRELGGQKEFNNPYNLYFQFVN